ncbi:MAG: class I SAM-dependent methyltransferase [Methylococcales bacterium]|nr:class I SAM-dependent methyltransferase [Methylococcales bacterium]
MNFSNNNINIYENKETANYYGNLAGLQEVEKYFFEKIIKPTSVILDVGIGGGRTTECLKDIVASYTGIDYSKTMIDICKQKYHGLDLHVIDATDLSKFASNSFDVVVFSFNGIDYIYPDIKRMKCLSEVYRVLKADGCFIFSSHYSRPIYIKPCFIGAPLHKVLWRIIRAIFKTTELFLKNFISKSFWTGQGYIYDSIHGQGGLLTHVTTPEYVEDELKSHGFKLIETVGNNFPNKESKYSTLWYYYSALKI